MRSSPNNNHNQKKVEALHDGGENRCLLADLSGGAVLRAKVQIFHAVRLRRAGDGH